VVKEEDQYENAIDKAGRFGWFQVMATIFMVFNFITNGHMLYALPFLELFPDYICPSDVPDCGPSDHCKDPLKFPVDWNSTRSLHNWVEIYNLDCVDTYLIGLPGSVYFIG
jgi:hypothetical protein